MLLERFVWKTYARVFTHALEVGAATNSIQKVCAWVGSSQFTLQMTKTTIAEGGRPGNIHGNHTSRTFMNGFQWRLYDSIRQMKQISMSNLILQIVHHLSFNQAQPYQIFYWFLSI